LLKFNRLYRNKIFFLQMCVCVCVCVRVRTHMNLWNLTIGIVLFENVKSNKNKRKNYRYISVNFFASNLPIYKNYLIITITRQHVLCLMLCVYFSRCFEEIEETITHHSYEHKRRDSKLLRLRLNSNLLDRSKIAE